MSNANAIAKLAGAGLPSLANLQKGLGAVVTNTAGGLSLPLLKKNGKASGWTVGQDNTPVDLEEDSFIVRTMTMQHGYVAWKDGNPKHVMVSIFDQPDGPDLSALPDQGVDSEGKAVPWKPCVSVELEGATGQFKGDTVIFQGSSGGAVDGFGKLAKVIFPRANMPGLYVQPVVQLDESSYQHKNKAFGRIYKPEFKVLGWLNLQDQPEPSGDPEVIDVQPVDEGAQGSAPAEKAEAPRRRRRANGD